MRGHVARIFVAQRCALLCADSSCVTHSRNRFCVLADLWLRIELRVTQSHNLFFAFWFLQFSRREPAGFCLEVFCRRTFLITEFSRLLILSAPPEGRIGPNSRVGAPPLSSRLRGPYRYSEFAGGVFFAGLLYNRQATGPVALNARKGGTSGDGGSSRTTHPRKTKMGGIEKVP